MSAGVRTSSTITDPRIMSLVQGSDDGLECSLHNLPKPLLREFRHVFGDEYLKPIDNDETGAASQAQAADRSSGALELLAIPTNQKAREDLVAVGDHIEEEKDRLLNVFINFGRDLCTKLRSQGYWADFIDPCSGLPMLTLGCNKVYSEVDGMECLLNYKAHNAGFCKILTHPKWGSAVYPATIFAFCPVTVANQILASYPNVASTDEGK
mmetsp:Transcript_15720/g.32208  ORF Transcript_15720/g.32208 Transcript_15720/m.32208 type:complete len:210 (-) Transcript_15720:42-671(-)|eukprot:CAMPEP_0183309388 /NCGR_PEP_ID=MMETSP0160_2-20130417/25287_1 /TAXON_ID=2839 ORGANISM="Odontella Sinensis, Strain Grunow 1884" /NCGR_SAMPLE_ID=MMETSP0160_2 /ASSEMBLY_ACC=CAM_ASM_000250 /LENGTH=209 /DNA_ID=CAMNT_0025473413 /DNA_START=90 /DNA_END=719 /DNA_ORIENTATION=-